jgi:hypothetical protein
MGGVLMVKVELEPSTLSVLIAGLYCTYHEVNSLAVPESIYLYVAEQLEYFLPDWNFDVISFEEWIKNCLFIYPKPLLSDEDIEYLQGNSLYWEMPNGNVMLVVSMDVRDINESK